MSTENMNRETNSQWPPKLRHELNCADVFDTELAGLHHEVIRAVKWCLSNWCVSFGYRSANASGAGKRPGC
jgi:hypothetical protein